VAYTLFRSKKRVPGGWWKSAEGRPLFLCPRCLQTLTVGKVVQTAYNAWSLNPVACKYTNCGFRSDITLLDYGFPED